MPNLNQNGAENNEQTNAGLHPEVEERLKWWAEKHGKSLDDATAEFFTYLKTELSADPNSEDDDFLIDAAEAFVVERRVMSGGTNNATELVGYFIGVDPKCRDAQERKRGPAIQAALSDLDGAIADGLVARAYTQDGVWMLEGKDGAKATEESADADPWFLVREHGLSLAILQNNPDWARFGEPVTPYRWQRTYYFLGNEKDNFLDDQRVLRITVTGKSADEWFIPQLFSECSLKVRPQSPNVKPEWADTYNAYPLPGALTYGNDFVDEEYRAVIAPDKLVPGLDAYIKDLSTLAEVFETRQEIVPGYNPVGPLVFIRGKVSDMRKEARETEWDPTGHDYSMSVSSFDLMRTFNGGRRQNLPLYIHGLLGDEAHPFDYATEEGWKPYAVKSTVIAFGRLSVRATDDGPQPALKTFGVFAVPRLAIPAGEGGDTSTTQYGE
ncbi:hypothetical protein [Phenylobacterium sp.]|uniref:hypothetical protein n=1 Tax=Phenylobacterium sp. TaxID=1871053 RepID=UPI000C8E8462|nr:hypothetical protein [Phenylobacterium sp.]MAK80900.1 hypothetical protein [Phenylobacterium sp.]